MSGEQLDPKEKLMIEAMVKEWGKELRSELALICQRSGGREKGKVRQYSRCNYFESNYDGYVEDEKEENFEQVSRHNGSKLRRDGARDREAVKLQSTPSIQKKHEHKSLFGEKSDPWINKENQSLPQQQLSEIMAAFRAVFDVKDAEAPNQQEEIVELDVADLRDEKCPREMVIRVDEEHLPENIFHAEDKEAEMVKSKEEKVETEENGSMHNSLLDQSDNLERVKNEEKSMDAMLCKENVWSTNDLDCQFPSIYSFVQAFDDISSDDAFHDVISIQGTEHQVKLEEINESETMKLGEEHKKQNFIPFDVEDGQDLRTNPLQEEGNDAARRSWISLYGPRIKDDMG